MQDFDGTIYIKDAPDIRLDGGLVHICYTSGSVHIAIVVRPSTFLKMLSNAKKLADEFNARGGVTEIKNARH